MPVFSLVIIGVLYQCVSFSWRSKLGLFGLVAFCFLSVIVEKFSVFSNIYQSNIEDFISLLFCCQQVRVKFSSMYLFLKIIVNPPNQACFVDLFSAILLAPYSIVTYARIVFWNLLHSLSAWLDALTRQ